MVMDPTDPGNGKAALDVRVEAIDRDRRAKLTGGILVTLLVCVVLTVSLSFLDPRNDWRMALRFHGPLTATLATAYFLQRRGMATLAGWILSFSFWLVVFAATWLFGGLEHQMATAYVVAVMIAAACLGSGAALFFGALSVAGASVVLRAHLTGTLPRPTVPVVILNSWISLTISIVIAAVLVVFIMRSLKAAVRESIEAAEERDQAKMKYLQAQRLEPVGRLASAIAHDFNNLLTVISGSASLLRDSRLREAMVGEVLDDLESAAARASQMTGQLLAFTRNRREELVVFDMTQVVREMGPLLARLLGSHVQVVLDLEERVLPVLADRGQFEQVVLNLAVNGRDAMPSGGMLRIVTKSEGESVILTVEDEGIGMTDEVLKDVFAPFFTTKESGSGIGLATVREIVNRFEGDITVKSQVGVGSSFTIRLHRSHQPLRTQFQPKSFSRDRKASGSILLVEDHELVRRTTKLVLEEAGYEVTTVVDGIEALALLEKATRFDALVVDAAMPKMDGIELLRRLERLGIAIPAVMVSGHLDEIPEELERLGFPVTFLRKPFSAEILEAGVRDARSRSEGIRKSQGAVPG